MLPEPLRQLMSAYAIGDLTPRRREAAERLLRHSGEARELLRELKRNRRRLRRMPKPELPPEFTARVLAALPDQPPIIRPCLLTRPQGQWTIAGRFAVAAVVLFGIGLSALLVNSIPESAGPAALAPRNHLSNPEVVQAPTLALDANPNDSAPGPVWQEPTGQLVKEVPAEKPATGPPSSPTPRPEPLGNVPFAAATIVQVKPPRLPLVAPMRSLDTFAPRQRVQHALEKSDAHHVDVFCRDPARAFDRLQSAMKSRGAKVIVDTVAQDLLKRKIRGQYVVYSDELTAADWARVLQQVGGQDKRAEEKHAGDGVFEQVVVLPFDVPDQKELTAVFGSDLSQPDGRPRRTADTSKDGKLALAGVVSSTRTSATSKPVHQYLDGRHDRSQGTIAVLLLIRLVGA